MKKLLLHVMRVIAGALVLWPISVLAQQPAAYRIEVVADGLEHPWSLAFLPDQRMLVTERPGRLRVIDRDGKVSEPVGGVPDVFVSGQAGLFEVLLANFEVLLAKDHDTSGIIYLSFAHGEKAANGTRIVRARFYGQRLHDVTPIFTAGPPKSGDAHFGGAWRGWTTARW